VEKEIYRFEHFVLDPAERMLSRDGIAVSLTPKALETLLCLVRNQGSMVTKEELLSQVWPDTFVEEISLAVNISTIRKALGESAHNCRYIATVPGHGYRFMAQVQTITTRKTGDNSAPTNGHDGSGPVSSHFAPVEWVNGGREIANSTGTGDGQVDQAVPTVLRKWIAPAAFLVLCLAGIAGYSWFTQVRANSVSRHSRSIAVLPFADLSPDKDQEYFSDGLTEELINNLARISDLKVVARSSAFQYKGKNEDLRSIGHRLGVSHILEGTVRREGDHVRISAELTETDDGFQLWSQTYDLKMGDILSVQDQIAAAVSEALQIKLLGANGSSLPPNRSTSPEAYEAYLQGQYFQGRGDSKDDLGKALLLANQAIKEDEHYAPAWVLRSTTYNLMAGFGLVENAEGMRKSREDAERAVALEPNLASAYLALGDIQLSYDWDWSGAEASAKKAADLEPGNVDVLRYESLLNEALGRLPEAIEFEKRAIAIDPLRARSYTSLGSLMYERGKYDEALSALQKALELNPQKEHDHSMRGEILLLQGRPQEALAEIDEDQRRFWRQFGEALAYHDLRRSADSDAALAAIIATDHAGAAFQIAEVYAYRHESDEAFAWLDRAYQQRDGGLTYVKVDPLLKNLRHDPRYSALLNKMHLPS
jgi:TolB-like protein/DNA-binding winged helix-turn-helix (wHTH) protein